MTTPALHVPRSTAPKNGAAGTENRLSRPRLPQIDRYDSPVICEFGRERGTTIICDPGREGGFSIKRSAIILRLADQGSRLSE
jgi:hypothetical protein